jgi:hypothetical protein
MSGSSDRLYQFLPAVYRLRDVDQGLPLQALLRIITEQADVIDADISQLYENWFIETCQDWVVPYIADLIGHTPVHQAGEPSPGTSVEDRLRNKILTPRREVANTIRFRRRKGTLSVLVDLAEAVAGWPARPVEFYKLLSVTQSINHLRLHRGRTADLREGVALQFLNGPFDRMAHTAEVRRILSAHDSGWFNIPTVGLFVWRLKSYSVSFEEGIAVRETPAYCVEGVGTQCFTFSVLGNDAPLYNHPQRELVPTSIPGEINLPVPIRRRAFEKKNKYSGGMGVASPEYYGPDKSLLIWAPNWPVKDAPQPIPIDAIVPADLSGWQYRANPGKLAVDPELGRIVFPLRQVPKEGVWVAYHYGFSADIGGGEYARPLEQPPGATVYTVGLHGKYPHINDALSQWKTDQPAHAVIEVTDSAVYVEQINISLQKDQTLELRASNGKRPVIRLLDWQTSLPDNLSVEGAEGSWFILDGFMVTGRAVQFSGDIKGATIRHCTLVPGWALECNCAPCRPADPSIEINDNLGCLTIEHSILGPISLNRDPVANDALPIRLRDSILDATSTDRDALFAPGGVIAYATLTLKRCTVFGAIRVHSIKLAENSIFQGLVTVARRQIGCIRFCYVSPNCRTPRRYECQPDLVEAAVQDQFIRDNGSMSPAQRDTLVASERLRVAPQFNSTRYGKPTYCQLSSSCALEIVRGADDESEMGVLHDLFQPQRAANLRVRLDEFTPAGMEAGIIFAS